MVPGGALPEAADLGETEVTIYVGGLHVADEPTVIRTLLGSCVSVCLWDPVTRVGGMNHFMLPRSTAPEVEGDALRFGVHAMDRLIGTMMKLGAARRRLVAKVFGGAHVLALRTSSESVAEQNVRFVRGFLRDEGIPVAGEDLGGDHARHVRFYTASGRALVRRISSAAALARLALRERRAEAAPPASGDVVLFEA
ncbi:MAG: chemotaxis protein CheD [Armatimonadota bacterium]|nr:chemotaxis protein CheD [Armatimonadota bacterium]MDR7553908.1 chemotaxis protein CheD [Armatimonadota bacterium]MDR7574106.1 chemotaxis protein CheD [Armatimonadota bacterium]